MDGRWVNTPVGRIFVPNGWRLWISKPRIQNIAGRDPRKTVSYRVVVSEPRDPRKTWRAKKHRRKHGTSNTFSRYRERDLTSGTFLRGRRDTQVKQNTVLGRLSLWDGFKRVAGSGGVITAGSDLQASIARQATWDEVHPGPPYTQGGPFKTVEVHLPSSVLVGHGSFTNQGITQPSGHFGMYEGSFCDNGFWLGTETYSTISSLGLSSFGSLSSYHTAAWDRTKPKLSPGNLGQFLYELKDLPGQLETTARNFSHIWERTRRGNFIVNSGDISLHSPRRGLFNRDFTNPQWASMYPRDLADNYLNHEFGWAPFIGDIVKLFDVWNHTAEHIARIARDNGHYVRRRAVLEESDVVTAPTVSGVDSGTIPSSGLLSPDGLSMCVPKLNPLGELSKGFCSFTKRTKRTVWAVGSMSFYRPEFDSTVFDGNSFDMMCSARRLMTLYGLRVTPTLLWKITPWTWLADWFTRFGDHIQRLDDFVQDGITARYLYVMEQKEVTMTKTSVLNFPSGPVTLNFVRRYSLKQRESADSPYGFNTPWQSLSPRQWAILGALGISRRATGYISRGA